MKIILFDSTRREDFLPLTYLRPMAALRMGVLTIAEKWNLATTLPVSFVTPFYLQKKYELILDEDNLLIDGGMLPDPTMVETVLSLQKNEVLFFNDQPLAFRLDKMETEKFIIGLPKIDTLKYTPTSISSSASSSLVLTKLSDIFTHNNLEITNDFKLLVGNRKSQPIPASNTVIGDTSNIFIEEGAVVEGAFLNSTQGVIYIGKGAEVMEGAVIRGSIAICDHAIVKPGCRLLKACTIGPYCKVDGEVNNTVFQGYSNKAHDGYIGNAVVGEWCNVGAGSNFSNMQNNYHSVKQWHYPSKDFRDTGLQFCGVVLGDHTKCGISSMFNSGAVTGICCNLFGTGFHPGFIPSFSYGKKNGEYEINKLEKVLEMENIACQRRDVELSQIDQEILAYVFSHITSINNSKID
ncbi:MAG: glucose-1-phosphate thymidylyltransferase [Bacteroidales bacterium]|jgi:UDP-N-acetylglucosamine diphosphorylase/glucosamine-1-phosphate N-acetyltransferase|nr:glucose-1-phosphate thymidylyltransferase [Bacteroidales bacterium]